MKTNELRKQERISSQKLIDELFGGGRSKSFAAFPLRAVWLLHTPEANTQANVQILVSVPKKRLHHAVDRNQVKRQIREAYRLAKSQLTEAVPEGQHLAIAFIWLSDSLMSSTVVADRVSRIIARINAQLPTP